MSDHEKEKLLKILNEQRQKINELEEKKGVTAGFGEYVQKTQYYSNMPNDPYSHQYQLLHRPHSDVKEFSDILDADIILSNINGDRAMLLCQRDLHFLTRFFDMGKRSPGVMRLFNTLYYSWRGQMRMTGALKGKERDLQSFLEPQVVEHGFSFPKKKKPKKRQGWQDYMTPQEEGSYE